MERIDVGLALVDVTDLGRLLVINKRCIYTANIERISIHRGLPFVSSKVKVVTEDVELHVTGKYLDLKAFIKKLDLHAPLYGI